MSVTQEEIEKKDFVGTKVDTPDGPGEVEAVHERYIFIKLKDGTFREFSHREVSLPTKKEKS